MQRRTLLLACPFLAQPAQAQTAQQGEVLAPGWRMSTLMRWGDAVLPDAPPWSPASTDAEAAAAQFGWDGRLVAAIASPRATDGVPRALLVVAHPTVDPAMAFADGRDRPEVAAAMQGASIINVENRGGGWVVSAGGFQSRRLHGGTLCRVSGAGTAGAEAARGVFGVDGGCAAPGGRLLLTEGQATDWTPRLPGRIGAGHGWVVECMAADPGAIPVKRRALGQGAWDAAATEAAGGRIVVFTAHAGGLARFVSEAAAADPDALDSGELSAARITPTGVLWQPLPAGAWQDMAAALRAAGASPLQPGTALAFGPAGLLVTAPSGGTMAWRPEGDAAAPRYTVSALAGTPAGQVASVRDGRNRLWLGVETPTGAAVLGDGGPIVSAPIGAGIGGLALARDGSALFTVLRAPGRGPGRSFARPATRWPDFTPGLPPRSAVVALSGGL